MKGVFYIWLLVSIGFSLFIWEPLPLCYLFEQGLSILITEIKVNCWSLQAFFHLVMIEATMLLGALNTPQVLLYPSLDTCLIQSSLQTILILAAMLNSIRHSQASQGSVKDG